MHFSGYRRQDGRVGVRNHVAVVSTVFCGSVVAQRVADRTGAVAITHENGCLELGQELEHTQSVLRGVVSHPNVGAVLVVGLGCEQLAADTLAEEATGKPAAYLKIQEAGGVISSIEKGIEIAQDLLQQASAQERVPADCSALTLATLCGASDTGSGLASNPVVGRLADMLVEAGGTVFLSETASLYGAAGAMAKRAVSAEIGQRIIEITEVMERHYARMGKSLKEANPTPGNIAGGLTTLVEKSLGGVHKGGTTEIQGVLGPAKAVPAGGRGLWIMDSSLGVDSHAVTDMVAGGAQIVAFTTGRGNPAGNPIAPVVKITATQHTVETTGDMIDFDASPVLLGHETIEEAGSRLYAYLKEVASGTLTKAEELGYTLFGIGQVAV